jgi:hypothetical protein
MERRCLVTCEGYVDGVELADVDLEDLASRILTEEIGRPEFVVEIYDHSTLVGTVHAGPLYPESSETPASRWCLTFSEPNEYGRWCLSVAATAEHRYHWYVFCGGEIEILEVCAVPLSAVLDAIRKCCEEGGRTHSVEWMEIRKAMNL